MYAAIEKQLKDYPIKETICLKWLGSFFKGGGFSRDNLVDENGYPAILYGDIYTQYEYKTSVITHIIDKASYDNSPKISKGDIVMAGTGETKDEIGKPILYTGDESVAVGGDVIVFHPNEGVNSEYLLYQLYSQSALRHRYINGKGDIIVHIYPTALGNTIIYLPIKCFLQKTLSIWSICIWMAPIVINLIQPWMLVLQSINSSKQTTKSSLKAQPRHSAVHTVFSVRSYRMVTRIGSDFRFSSTS